MHQYCLKLVNRHAAGKRGIGMNTKLLEAAQPCENTKGQYASRFLIEFQGYSMRSPKPAPSQHAGRSS